ncbi:hypothetical protein AB0O76_06405 [Streptomyces sp. NPDC086554]|uniref:hypothetical protein n=1 Tax=Streptomyces sp. NPDC086554 TaxID=3154864 RepID=UPI0034495B51
MIVAAVVGGIAALGVTAAALVTTSMMSTAGVFQFNGAGKLVITKFQCPTSGSWCAPEIATCDRFTGNNTGAEPHKTGSGPDGKYCRFTAGDISYK